MPASGYWEWLARSKTDKAPFCHHLPDWEPFAFAALWTHNKHVDLISCTIITAEADPAVAHVHKRMPVILKNENHDSWLDPDTTSEQALSLLQGHRGGDLLTYEAEKAVNSAHNEGQDLLKPVQQAI